MYLRVQQFYSCNHSIKKKERNLVGSMFSRFLSQKVLRCKHYFISSLILEAFSKASAAVSLNKMDLTHLFQGATHLRHLSKHGKPVRDQENFSITKENKSKKIPVQETQQKTPLILLDKIDNKGRGVLAGRAFQKNTEVLQFFGEIRDRDTFDDLTYALQIGPREFISASGDFDDFVNHSCEPNCGMHETKDKRVVLFALREIGENEEITFDYAMSQSGRFLEFECQCGAPSCRGLARDFEDLPKKTQETYIKRNAVLPYLLKNTSLKRNDVL